MLSSTSTSTSTSAISSTSTSSNPYPTYNNTLTIDLDGWTIEGLNQLNAFSGSVWPDLAANTVFQSLVDVNIATEYSPGGGITFLPDLASNWTVSSNGTIYTFNLRQNINFSNGDPFNAYQVWTVFYGNYYLSGNASSWYNGYLLFNMNPVEFGPATLSLLNQSGVINPSPQMLAIMSNSSWPIYVVNQYTIAFHTIEPFQWFLGTIVGAMGQIYDAQYMLEHGGLGTPTAVNSYFNLNPLPGTGPYMISEVSNQAYIGYTQNPTYWDQNLTASGIAANPLMDPGQVKNVLIQIRPDPTTRYLDLSDGAAQIAAIGPQSWNLIIANPDKYGHVSLPSTAGLVAGEVLNTQLYPTNITDVRLAIVHAVNVSNIISEIYGGSAAQIVPPEYPAWSQFYDLGNYTPYSYNLTLAAQYLKEAGFPNGNGLPTLSYVVSSCNSLDCAGRAEIVQADLAQIGINVNINILSGDNWCEQAGCEPYTWLINNSAGVGNIEDIGGNTNSPTFLSPAEYWTEFVSNTSAFGDTAEYATAATNGCDASFFNGSSIATLQSICGQAQAEIEAQAPYFGWVVPSLNLGASAVSWDKSVVSSAYFDTNYGGVTDLVNFNTVVFT